MAKIFAPPASIESPPSIEKFMSIGANFDLQGLEDAEEAWIKKLREWCIKNGSGQFAGEIVRYGVADGYAQYMVYKMRPLSLIHLPTRDGYHFDYADRWNATDIKQMVARQKAMAKLFGHKS
jgi:hypothetical protein